MQILHPEFQKYKYIYLIRYSRIIILRDLRGIFLVLANKCLIQGVPISSSYHVRIGERAVE